MSKHKGSQSQPPGQRQSLQSSRERATNTTPTTSRNANTRGGTADAAVMQTIVECVSRDVDVSSVMSLELRGKGLARLPASLGAVLTSVRKLDLRGNDLTDLSPLSSLPHLSNLNVSENARLRSLHTLKCTRLIVLAVAGCGLTSLKGVESSATTLRTLIANDNAIELQTPAEQRADPSLPADVRNTPLVPEAVENYTVLSRLTACETVVLTRNRGLCRRYPATDSADEGDAPSPAHAGAEEEEEGAKVRQRAAAVLAAAHPLSVFACMGHLRKLSLSDCGLACLPARWFLPLVVELRLGQNSLRSLRPEGVIARSLKTLDVSHNALTTIATLRRCRYVQRIFVRGNPFVDVYVARDREEDREAPAPTPAGEGAAAGRPTLPRSLRRSLRRLLTSLESIDGQPLLSAEALVSRRRARCDGSDEEESVPEKDSDGAPVGVGQTTTKRPRRASPPAPAIVQAEAEERDVVVDAPASVVRDTQPAIVRRERTSTAATRKGVVLSGGAAVAKLLERKRQSHEW